MAGHFMLVQQMMLVGICYTYSLEVDLATESLNIIDAQQAIRHASLIEVEIGTLVEQFGAVHVKQCFLCGRLLVSGSVAAIGSWLAHVYEHPKSRLANKLACTKQHRAQLYLRNFYVLCREICSQVSSLSGLPDIFVHVTYCSFCITSFKKSCTASAWPGMDQVPGMCCDDICS